jgi:hypothetical protein
MAAMNRLEGTCHCTNVAIVLETEQDPRSLPLRACDCSFCRRHGARTTADPAGRARIGIQDRSLLSLYQFGLRTAQMVVCARCGMYCAGVLREGDRAWAVQNANLFLDPAFDRPPQPVSYEGETAEQRIARRKRLWTPLVSEWVPGAT